MVGNAEYTMGGNALGGNQPLPYPNRNYIRKFTYIYILTISHYKIFAELTKNPKMLNQADELLASASALLSTRLASPAPPDSDTDSGI